MSEFHVQVVRIGEIQKHPNADTLSITHVHGGYPVIFRTGDYQTGDLAVYLPVDSVIASPKTVLEHARWDFLGDNLRIKAKKLRGIFSMGMLTTAQSNWEEGQDVQEELFITKYDPETKVSLAQGGENESDPGVMPVYDIEGLRKNEGFLMEGETVWISEKIHGANARFHHDGEKLYVGSRTRFRRQPTGNQKNLWWEMANRHNLVEKLANYPEYAIYGEVYGNVQDLKYGVPAEETARFALFDILNIRTRQWVNPYVLHSFAATLDLPIVPTLYVGPWHTGLRAYAEGRSTICPGHVREGIVIKNYADYNRVCLKLAGEGYLLRKGG